MKLADKSSFLKYLNGLFYATLIILLLGDIGRKIAIHHYSDFLRYTAVSKGVVLLLYGVFLLFFLKIYWGNILRRQLIYAIGILCVTFLVSQVFLDDTAPLTERISKNLVYLSRFIFLPITFLLFHPILKEQKYVRPLLKLFEVFFFINCGLILLGALTDVVAFRTYLSFNRYGYMGIYNSNNQASFYFMFMIVYYYYTTFFQSQKPYKLIIAVIFSLLIGTKKIYFFYPLLLLFDFLYFKRYQQKWFWGIAIFISAGLVVFYEKIGVFLSRNFRALADVYEQDGFIAFFTSTRNMHLELTISEVIEKKWTALNYILGGAQFYKHRPEMELFDVYFFFGIIGVILYYWLFRKLIIYFEMSLFLKCMLFIFIFTGLIAAGFIVSANQPILFLLVFSCIYLYEKKKSNVINPKQ